MAKAYYAQSLATGQELGDQIGVATTLNNFGNLLYRLGEYDKAEEYYKECLTIREKLEQIDGIATLLNNLGLVHYARKNHDEALECYCKCLALSRQLGNEEGIAASLNNMGEVENAVGNFDQAYTYHLESLEINRRNDAAVGLVYTLNNLGNASMSLEEYKLAESYFCEALSTALDIQIWPQALTAIARLAELYIVQGKTLAAHRLLLLTAHHEQSEELVRSRSRELLKAIDHYSSGGAQCMQQEAEHIVTIEQVAHEILRTENKSSGRIEINAH